MSNFEIRSSIVRNLVLSLIALPLLAGCVSRGTYDDVVAERDAAKEETVSVKMNNVVLGRMAISLSGELALRDSEVTQLQKEQRELADDVERWAIRGAIEMKLLADGLHLILPHDVLFQSGSASLKPEGSELVKELVIELEKQPYQIAVLGFTDNVPVGAAVAERYPSNWELSGARAASVVRVLESEGIPTNQLVAVARGETGPIASNDTPEGRAQNRRIDVRIRPVVPAEE
jgi:chemotaxis protein MotB